MYLTDFINKNLHVINDEVIVNEDILLKVQKSINNERRYLHSRSVAKLCYEVALSNKLDNPLLYYFTGLVHDIAKGLSKEELASYMNKYCKDCEIDEEFAYHAFVGAVLVEKLFSIFDKEVLDAIKYHCTGRKNMSKLEKIVYACDKIDPLRGYDSSDMIKAMKKDYESGFKYVLGENKKFLLKKHNGSGSSIKNKYTKECFEYYLEH